MVEKKFQFAQLSQEQLEQIKSLESTLNAANSDGEETILIAYKKQSLE